MMRAMWSNEAVACRAGTRRRAKRAGGQAERAATAGSGGARDTRPQGRDRLRARQGSPVAKRRARLGLRGSATSRRHRQPGRLRHRCDDSHFHWQHHRHHDEQDEGRKGRRQRKGSRRRDRHRLRRRREEAPTAHCMTKPSETADRRNVSASASGGTKRRKAKHDTPALTTRRATQREGRQGGGAAAERDAEGGARSEDGGCEAVRRRRPAARTAGEREGEERGRRKGRVPRRGPGRWGVRRVRRRRGGRGCRARGPCRRGSR